MTTVINFFGGPGAGKSTTAAGLFHLMKRQEVSCELVNEFAKELTWEKREPALMCQPYIFGKQLLRLERLKEQVDFIITDSPLLLSAHYSAKYYPPSFVRAVEDIFDRFDNINFLIQREKTYVAIGRNQTEEEAIEIDEKIAQMLSSSGHYWRVISTVLSPELSHSEVAYWNLQNMVGIKIPKVFT